MLRAMGVLGQPHKSATGWAVISKDGLVHQACAGESGLPTGKALCGAVGTTVHMAGQPREKLCTDCLGVAAATAS
jgi:hypothetical protein